MLGYFYQTLSKGRGLETQEHEKHEEQMRNMKKYENLQVRALIEALIDG